MSDTDMLYMVSLEKRLEGIQAENKELKDLLREVQPVLKKAFFAHFTDTNAANELYDRITKLIGGAENV